MGTAAKRTRDNRTITVDFRDDATYLQLLGDGKAFVEFVGAFLLALGFQLAHKATCHGGGCLTRHSHYVRLRVRGITIWRLQCTTCKAVIGRQSCFQCYCAHLTGSCQGRQDMCPWMTNMQSVARDAHEHIFASTGTLAFANEHSGSAAPPAPYNAFAERQQAWPCAPHSHPRR